MTYRLPSFSSTEEHMQDNDDEQQQWPSRAADRDNNNWESRVSCALPMALAVVMLKALTHTTCLQFAWIRSG